jgi:hypothetical protein
VKEIEYRIQESGVRSKERRARSKESILYTLSSQLYAVTGDRIKSREYAVRTKYSSDAMTQRPYDSLNASNATNIL